MPRVARAEQQERVGPPFGRLAQERPGRAVAAGDQGVQDDRPPGQRWGVGGLDDRGEA